MASLKAYQEIEIAGVADLSVPVAETFAKEHGCRAYPSVEALLGDGAVQVAVNLTPQQAHRDVIAACLRAGKHVFSEKPLAMTVAHARELVDLAERAGLRLGCAPSTFLGEAQQTAWKCVREGRLGTVRLVYVDQNHARIEKWHPAPVPFFQAGPLFDLAAYPLVFLTSVFGPVRRVQATGTTLCPERVDVDGKPFRVEAPDCIVAIIELSSGPLVRLTANYYVDESKKQNGIELHGDDASLHVTDEYSFNAGVSLAAYGEEYAPVALLQEPYQGVEWGRGLRDLVAAIAEDRPHRATGRQEAHIVEVICAAHESLASGQPVEVRSDFDPPPPMPWAE